MNSNTLALLRVHGDWGEGTATRWDKVWQAWEVRMLLHRETTTKGCLFNNLVKVTQHRLHQQSKHPVLEGGQSSPGRHCPVRAPQPNLREHNKVRAAQQ